MYIVVNKLGELKNLEVRNARKMIVYKNVKFFFNNLRTHSIIFLFGWRCNAPVVYRTR